MKKIKIIFINLFLCISSISTAQNALNTESKDSTNIYYHALTQYCDLVEKNQPNITTIYVEKDNLISEKLPEKIGRFSILYFDFLDIKRYLKKSDKMTLVKIIPLRVKQDDFYVNVIPFSVSYSKKNFNYVNSGGLSAHYRFSKEKSGLIFKFSKFSGI